VESEGSHGIDGMTVYELKQFLKMNWSNIREEILSGEYKPMPVRRVEIPKPNGGTRLLGIPTVLDRFIQQAIAQELNTIYDNKFSENSFGFRPKRRAKDAIMKAQGYINEGYRWVVDIDLEKFFDKVNHDILMYKLSKDIHDKRAGERVMDNITNFIESKLKLKVNKVKSAVDRPWKRKFLGFTLNIMFGKAYSNISKQSLRRHKEKLKDILNRSKPVTYYTYKSILYWLRLEKPNASIY